MKCFWLVCFLALGLTMAGCAVQVNEDGEAIDQSDQSLDPTGADPGDPEALSAGVRGGVASPTPDPYQNPFATPQGGLPNSNPLFVGDDTKPTPDPMHDPDPEGENDEEGDPSVSPWGTQLTNSQAGEAKK